MPHIRLMHLERNGRRVRRDIYKKKVQFFFFFSKNNRFHSRDNGCRRDGDIQFWWAEIFIFVYFNFFFLILLNVFPSVWSLAGFWVNCIALLLQLFQQHLKGVSLTPCGVIRLNALKPLKKLELGRRVSGSAFVNYQGFNLPEHLVFVAWIVLLLYFFFINKPLKYFLIFLVVLITKIWNMMM